MLIKIPSESSKTNLFFLLLALSIVLFPSNSLAQTGVLACGGATQGEVHFRVIGSASVDVNLVNLTNGQASPTYSIHQGTNSYRQCDLVFETNGPDCDYCADSSDGIGHKVGLRNGHLYSMTIDGGQGEASKTYTFADCTNLNPPDILGWRCPDLHGGSHPNSPDVFITYYEKSGPDLILTGGDAHDDPAFEIIDPSGEWIAPYSFRGNSGANYSFFLHLGGPQYTDMTIPGPGLMINGSWYSKIASTSYQTTINASEHFCLDKGLPGVASKLIYYVPPDPWIPTHTQYAEHVDFNTWEVESSIAYWRLFSVTCRGLSSGQPSLSVGDFDIATTLEEARELKIGTFPNPTVGRITANYTIPEDGAVTIEVFDLLGKRRAVLFSGWEKKGVYRLDDIDLRSIVQSAGTYIISIRQNQQTQSVITFVN